MKYVVSAVQTYDRSTWEPKARPEELTAWWARELPRRSVYRPYIVKVLEQTRREGRQVLTFELVQERGQTSRVFTVTLPTESGVWPDLPSTAQIVGPESPGPYGFLFLSDDWAMRHQVETEATAALTEGNHKFPLIGMIHPDLDLGLEDTERVLRAMGDPVLRAKLLKVLDATADSSPTGQE